MPRTVGSAWDCVLTLAAVHEDHVSPGGSGFMLTSGLAITASHIFDGFFDKLGHPNPLRDSAPSYSVLACQIVERGSLVLQWSVTRLFRMPSAAGAADDDSAIDITFIELTPLGTPEETSSPYRQKRP